MEFMAAPEIKTGERAHEANKGRRKSFKSKYFACQDADPCSYGQF